MDDLDTIKSETVIHFLRNFIDVIGFSTFRPMQYGDDVHPVTRRINVAGVDIFLILNRQRRHDGAVMRTDTWRVKFKNSQPMFYGNEQDFIRDITMLMMIES